MYRTNPNTGQLVRMLPTDPQSMENDNQRVDKTTSYYQRRHAMVDDDLSAANLRNYAKAPLYIEYVPLPGARGSVLRRLYAASPSPLPSTGVTSDQWLVCMIHPSDRALAAETNVALPAIGSRIALMRPGSTTDVTLATVMNIHDMRLQRPIYTACKILIRFS